MNTILKISTVLAFSIFATTMLMAQYTNPAPMEIIAPDARSAGMADIGTATSPDAYSQYWNVAKYALSENNGAAGLSYTPWMWDGANLFYLAGFYKIGKQAISASLHYMTVGDIDFRTGTSQLYRTVAPSLYSFDLGYSRSFGDYLSAGLAFRYLSVFRGENSGDNTYTTPSTGAFAADIGIYLQHPVGKDEYAVGLSFKNIGTKVDMGSSKMFLPMCMNLGGRYSWTILPKHRLNIALDINKPLVPDDQSKNVAAGFFTAFGNNIKEWGLSGGLEYAYMKQFFLRAGYHLGSSDALYGSGSYFSAGAGLMWYDFSLDFSYMVSTNSNAAMTNTVRVALQYAFGKVKAGKTE